MTSIAARPESRQPMGDPLLACVALAVLFCAVALVRLDLPTKPVFDEVHYLPAVRNLLELSRPINSEHPMVAKEFMAIGFWLFGDTPFGWRVANVGLGSLGLFAAMRALWWASGNARATVLFGLFLATDGIWFMLSRVAMLDMAMAAMLACAFWQWARALSGQGRARVHLALAGVFLGLSLGAKWNGAPLAILPGVLFAIRRWQVLEPKRRGQWLTATAGGPVPGVSLVEAAFWLGSLPLVVYFASFIPTMFYAELPLNPAKLLWFQNEMLKLQDSVVKPHRYMSQWWQWVLTLRPIWFFYENWDGAQRGVLMIGNPLSMVALLPAVGACGWLGWRGGGATGRTREAGLMLALVLFYIMALVFWAVNGKPVQFYYHYNLAATFGLAALALMVDRLWATRFHRLALGVVAGTAVMAAVFYPIMSAMALPGPQAFNWWMWLDSWR